MNNRNGNPRPVRPARRGNRGAIRLFPVAVLTIVVLVLLIGYLVLRKDKGTEILVYDLIKDNYWAEDLLKGEVLVDVDFGMDAAAPYLVKGFSSQYEDWGSGTTIAWSDGPRSTINVPIHDLSSDKKVFLRCQPYMYEGMNQQKIEISVNNQYLTTLDLDYDMQEYQFPLPVSLLKEGDNTVTFVYGQTAVPSRVVGGDDIRALAVAFDYFKIKNPERQKQIGLASWTIDNDTQGVVAQTPDEVISYYLEIPVQAKLKFDLGVRPEVWGRFKEAKFEVLVESETTTTQSVFSKSIRPDQNKLEWLPQEVDLAEFGGKLIRMSLWVYGASDENPDPAWMGWSKLRVIAQKDKSSTAAQATDAETDKKRPEQKFNIILIVADGLRFDHLSYSGYQRRTSPNIDALALESAFFSQAISQANAALASHTTIFTSMYPYAHKAWGREDIATKPHITTWLNIMKAKGYGYLAAAFVDDPQMKDYYKTLGFETFMPEASAADADPNAAANENPDREEAANTAGAQRNPRVEKLNHLMASVTEWLGAHTGETFFLVVQTNFLYPPFVPTAPYNQIFFPEYYSNSTAKLGNSLGLETLRSIQDGRLEIEEVDVEQIRALYDGTIRCLDLEMGNLFQQLNTLDLGKNTIIVLTSAHGMPLAEHGEVKNVAKPGYSLYDEEIHVPLIIRLPNVVAYEKKSVPSQARLLDIMPTVLDVMGMRPIEKISGTSLWPLLKGRSMDLIAASQSRYSDMVSIRTNEWKLLCKNSNGLLEGLELFNIKIDNKETNDFKSKKPILANYLRQELYGRLNFPEKF